MSIMKLILYLSLVIFSYEQLPQCVLGQNCPLNHGNCIANSCQCKEGFYTLLDKSLPAEQQIYCNYAQASHFKPLIIEFFLPSIGHFLVGHFWLGIIKLSLILPYFIITYYLYGTFKLPRLFITLLNKFGFEFFLGLRSSREEQILELIREITGDLGSLMHFADLFLYALNVYKDGNGVPFI